MMNAVTAVACIIMAIWMMLMVAKTIVMAEAETTGNLTVNLMDPERIIHVRLGRLAVSQCLLSE